MNTKMNFDAENTSNVHLPDYTEKIAGILRSNLTPKSMKDSLLSYHENDIASALELIGLNERERLYRILDAETLAGILEYTDDPADYINELSIRKKVAVLSQFEISDAVNVLHTMDKHDRDTIIDLLDDELKREIVLLSSFDDDEIGGKMSTNYVAIPSGCSVREAMRELIRQAADNDNISTIYVIDEDGTLIGAIELKDLIIARENTPIEDITMTSYPYVYANEQTDSCIERIRGYSEDSIPVLSPDNKLEGVLTSQTLTELVGDALEDDYAKLGGLSAEEDIEEPIKKSVFKRLPWLVVLLGLGLIVSTVVGAFEEVVAQLAVIVSFQSLILDMAGNVGTQSLAVTIRVLMDERVSKKQKLRLVAKEAGVGFVNGLILGLLSFVLIGAYMVFFKNQPALFSFSVSLCTGISLFAAIMLSSVTGTVVPICFKKLSIDPAVASGPLITTINDLVAVVTYYGLSWLLLINILHL